MNRLSFLNPGHLVITFLCVLLHATPTGAQTNLVANGSFESLVQSGGSPLDWSTSGAVTIKQSLTTASGRDGKHCAKLQCAEFSGDGQSAHAMICQTGKVTIRRGQWYHLSLWAKADQIEGAMVEVGLTNMKPWENGGLSDAFTPTLKWQQFDFWFQAKNDVPAATSRLQFWFRSKGTLWLDDVALTESRDGRQWYPQISADKVKNFVPNSSFECGSANWGSFTYGLNGGWVGNLYRFEGDLDTSGAQHGRHCLKIELNSRTLPTFWFDYYEPVHQPVRRVLAANRGWFRVKRGEALTLSAWMRADAKGVIAQMAAVEPGERMKRKEVTLDKQWQRYEFTFKPHDEFLFIALGPDLDASKRESATVWIDAVQLEHGEHASDYEPRTSVESFVQTSVAGNIFKDVSEGAKFTVHAFNNAEVPNTLTGQFTVTDFFDHPVFETQPQIKLQPHGNATFTVDHVCSGRRGFFLANWAAADSQQSLRAAIIEPSNPSDTNSPIGFNHAYPWQYAVKLAREAGVAWWRDWSAKWETVEPEKGKFDFSAADEQINRVLQLDSEVEVLLPFPSANWATSAPADILKKAATGRYPDSRMPVAFAPKNQRDFDNYAAAAVRHYRSFHPRPITTFQVLNEPVYTHYALPRTHGYSLNDYIAFLKSSYAAMKAADPQCRIVGGVSANLSYEMTRQFVERGGLNSCDIFDLHMYNACSPAESYDKPFRELEELMRAHGGPKPFWITEWGCYADDDPPCIPQTVGDATMNRCKWPSEKAATEHIVKFTAVGFAHGLRKLFFHAGTCGTINHPDAGGVLFEYGCTPRRMYAGIAALTKIFGVPEECVKASTKNNLQVFVFKAKGRAVGVAWSKTEKPVPLKLQAKVRAYDVMGNELPAVDAVLGESPVYLVSRDSEAIVRSLPQ